MLNFFIITLNILLSLEPTEGQPGMAPQSLTRDHVIDTVRCKAATNQSYALFLPSQYDSKKQWPVILIFDPGARGKTGVNAFLEAGRKYGFILACSNNSHNGPMADSFTAAAAMLQDINERFSADQKRVYVAGFSGGSRLALSIAVTNKGIAGVIGCGAGLPNDRNFMPSGSARFVYYGLAGNRDMNYIELHDLPEFFSSQTNVASYFKGFDGGHEWPGPALITGAVEWLMLQEMNRKIIEPDHSFISEQENKSQEYIDGLLSAGNAYDAALCMSCAARDFRGTPFGNKMSQLMTATEKAQPYQKGVRKWNKMTETEGQKREKYMNYLMHIVQSGNLPDTASIWWKHETNSLVWLREKGSPENSQMASRVLNFISILCSEQGTSYYRNRSFPRAVIFFEVCTLSDSENPANYFNLARSLAGADKPKESLDALEAAVKHGMNSRKIVEADPVFQAMRNEKRYVELVRRLK
jgi:predicted esterase